MKSILNIVFYIGFLFFGGGFLIAFGQFVAYNGLGNVFEYKEAENFTILNDTVSMPAKLKYTYVVNNKQYDSYQNVSERTATISDSSSKFTVLYNTTFNNLSIIKELNARETKTWDQTVGMIVFGTPFLFLLLIFIFADKDKWIGVYTRGEYKSSKR